MNKARSLVFGILAGGLLAGPAAAHGGMFRGSGDGPRPLAPPPPGHPGAAPGMAAVAVKRTVQAYPGGGPEVPFVEDRWEFWWEFSHDSLLDLRPRLLKGAGSGPMFKRLSAADKRQQVLPQLLKALRDKNDLVRSAATYALARLEDPSVYPYLSSALLDDSSLAVRTHAALALGQARVPRSMERLRSIVWDSGAPDEVRAYAAVSLGVLGTPDASTALREAVAGPQEGQLPYTVRLAAAYALGLTEDQANAPYLRSLSVAGQADEGVRALFVLSLGRVGDRAAHPILLRSLRDRLMQVRRSAAVALGVETRPDDLESIKALHRAAETDADVMVRHYAEISLGRIAARGSPAIVERQRARLLQVPSRQRAFVALALGISGDQSTYGDLATLMQKEGSNSLRAAGAVALALLGDSRAVPDLRELLRSTGDPYLRGYLAFALGSLGDQKVRPDLKEMMLHEVNPELLRWSAVGLALLGDASVHEVLQQAYAEGSGMQGRASAVYATGLLGGRDAIPLLVEIASNEAEITYVRAYAVYALGMICDTGPEPLPSIYARDHNYTLELSFVPELYFLF